MTTLNKCILFDKNEERLALFPIRFPEIKEFLDKQRSVFWTVNEIQLTKDNQDWEKLTNDERHFLKFILAFFAVSDKVVNMNIEARFIQQVKIYEVEMN